MPKRTYRKKSGKKGSKKSYRKKGSKKGSKKSYRKKASKRCPKGEVRSFKRLANGKLGVGKCMPKPFAAKKLAKKEEQLENAIIAGAPAPVVQELKQEVKDAKKEVEVFNNLEGNDYKYDGDYEFNLAALGWRIKKGRKGSKKSYRKKGSKKSYRKKGSKKSYRKKGSKKSRGKKYSKRR